jgi:predicted ATPase
VIDGPLKGQQNTLELEGCRETTTPWSRSAIPKEVFMNRFSRLRVQGFRRLFDLQLELRPLGVLIGANGSGKTSLLDVFSLLAASASGKLSREISEMEGLVANLTVGRSEFMAFELQKSVPEQPPLEYRLSIAPRGPAYEIVEESLTQQRNSSPTPFKHIQSHHGDIRYYKAPDEGLVRPNWEHNPLETSLSQVPKLFQAPEDLRMRLASSTHYHVLNVASRSPVRLPQPLRPATLPGVDGEDLVSCLFYLRETDRERFEAIEETLRAGFKDFARLDFPPVAAGTLAMTWRDRNFSQPLYMHQLSEGTLRFLWLATLLQSPGLTAVTLIDEPEVSLHPELLSLLADLMREASSRTQLIVATHADRLVRFLNPAEVVVMDIAEDGEATVTWADQLDLDAWLSDYTLDEVWHLGRMGGRP